MPICETTSGLRRGIEGGGSPGKGCCIWEQQGRGQLSSGGLEMVLWVHVRGGLQWVAEEVGGVKAGGWSVEAFVPSGGPQTLVARFALAVFCVYGVSDVAGRHHRGLCGIHLVQITSQIHVELLRLF